MTATSTLPERLLALGAGFTRHHDVLQSITLLRGPNPASNLLRHIPTTQSLAREALEMFDALRAAPRLYHSPDVRAAMERSLQLAALATLAVDHLIGTVDILQNAAHARRAEAVARHGEARLEAGRRTTLAGRFTSLGAEDCLATARLLACELHRQRLAPVHRPPAFSSAQRTALETVAAGRVTLDRLLDKPYVQRGDARVTISTIRSLEARGLVHREPCTLVLHDERVHLTPDGCRALAAALSQPRSTTAATERPAARPTATVARAAAR
ncbi:hypothetical protein ACFWNG_05030 [Streptomyces sp. NPDC058391]|uniref:hypothetical protein n=1 Tax=Streptomyces sp. NPDC058391 TaxID=3346476 RepID=UPI0036505365